MRVVEQSLVFSMAAFNLSVMSGSIRTNELVANAEVLRCFLKQSLFIFEAFGETIGEFKAIVSLHAFNLYAKPLKTLYDLF